MSSNSSKDKVESSTKVYKHECLSCENYKRKVKEAEQTVSGRDVLIEMLQQEIKKMEGRYKTSIDDYEQLRFKYCTVVQDLSNLKEIHKKLEKSNSRLSKERDITKKNLEVLEKEMEECQNQCKVSPIKPIPSEGDGQRKKNIKETGSLHQDILKEVMNIEAIMQNQNETVKEVLQKVLNEMKGAKQGPKQIEEVLQKKTTYITTLNENLKDESKETLLVIIEDLNKKIDELNNIVEKLKLKNASIINQISEKKSNLAECLDVLQDNHSNLNNLSGNIEMIIKEKDTYLNETIQLKRIIEENVKSISKKDTEISALKSKLNSTQEQPEIDNLMKRNQDLQKALNECEADLEKLQEDYLQKERQCTIEKCNQIAKVLLEAENNGSPVPVITVDKNTEVSSVTKNKGTDPSSQHIMEIDLLKERINTLEHDLEQAKLENSEYEEENKYYCQKVENLTTQIQNLEKEKMDLENNASENINTAELKEKYEVLISHKENEVKQLRSDINNIRKNSQEDYLRNQLINLQNEVALIQEKDEEHIFKLQDKIDTLENSQYKKQVEIDQCCCVVRNIKESIADKNFINENNLAQLKYTEEQKHALEKDNQQLQNYIAKLQNEVALIQEKYKDCDCRYGKVKTEKSSLQRINTELANDIKELEAEVCHRECINEKLQNDIKEMELDICRKQCTINHLEQCLDKSNKILAECEKEMKAMQMENENSRKENESLRNEYAVEAERSTSEKNNLEEKVSKLHRQSQDLEMEKGVLSMSLKQKSNVEDELNQMEKKFNNLIKASKEKDEELTSLKKETEDLKQTSEANKKEYDRIARSYKEIKETLAVEIKKYKDETEKLIKERESFGDFNPNVKCTSCMELKKLQSLIVEKERTIRDLEQQNRELATEVAQLKAYVHKVITDNKNLRTAIDNLLTTLVEKLKSFTDNEERISLQSNEVIVKDILNSLMDLEKSVMVSNSTSTEKCNCMSVIMSTYKIDPRDPKVRNLPCRQKCGRRIRDISKYVNSKLSSSQGIISACQDCCNEREKGQDDQPENPSGIASRSVSDSFVVEPDNSR